MVKADSQVTINQPISQVFDFLASNYAANLQKWQTSVQEIQQTTAGPVNVGTTFQQVRMVRGKPVASTVQVAEFQPWQRFALNGQGSEQTVRAAYTLTPVTDTSTSLALEIELEGGFPRMAAPMVGREIKKETQADLDRLKGLLG